MEDVIKGIQQSLEEIKTSMGEIGSRVGKLEVTCQDLNETVDRRASCSSKEEIRQGKRPVASGTPLHHLPFEERDQEPTARRIEPESIDEAYDRKPFSHHFYSKNQAPTRGRGRGFSFMPSRMPTYKGTRPEYDTDEDELIEPRHQARMNRTRPSYDNDLSTVKVTIPSFYGSNQPEEFLDWKTKCEMIFASHFYSDRKQVYLATVEFKEYAHTWWMSRIGKWKHEGTPIPQTWEALTEIMAQ